MFHADPYPVYAEIRKERGPHYLESENAWLFTRYDDVATMLKEARVSKNFQRPQPLPLDMSMLFQDPPAHTRQRGLVTQAFTRARILALEARIEQIADDLLNRVAAARKMDFHKDFAVVLPVVVISEMLGVPEAERETFHHWSVKYVHASEAGTPESMQEVGQALMTLIGYFSDLIERRRKEPQSDILSAMIQAHDAEDRLSSLELLGTAMLLLIAGHETTTNLLSSGLYCLLRHHEQLARLRNKPDLLDSAIDEMLRFESPVQQGTFRIVREPILLPAEMGGITLEVGTQVYAAIGAANRDPIHFSDPDRFDITRNPNRHLAFGYGIHYCLGAILARTEARISFRKIVEHFPALRLDIGPETVGEKFVAFGKRLTGQSVAIPPAPTWNVNRMVRSLNSMPVRW